MTSPRSPSALEELLGLGLGPYDPKSFLWNSLLLSGCPHQSGPVVAGGQAAQGAVGIRNKDPPGELFPLKICSLAATGDVWQELMRNVRWKGGGRRGLPGRGQRGIEILQGAGGGAGPDTGRVIDLEVPICSN